MNSRALVLLTAIALLLCVATEAEPCTMDGWRWVHLSKKFVKVFDRSPQWCSSSITMCERVGGQLAVLPTQESRDELRSIVDCNQQYWIGLTTSDTGNYTWVDGTPLDPNTVWAENGQPTNKRYICAGWNPCANFSSRERTTELNRVCEAKKPCSSRPVIAISQGQKLENEIVTLPNGDEIIIRCFLRGFQENTKAIRLTCSWDENEIASGFWIAAKTISTNISMHSHTCYCTSTLKDMTQESSNITILIQSSPLFQDENPIPHNFSLRVETYLSYSCVIFAYPEPTLYRLMKNDKDVPESEYVIKAYPMKEKEGYLRVTIALHVFELGQNGTYTVVIGNGIPKNLELSFHLFVKPGTGFVKDSIIKTTVIYSILLMVLVTALVGLALYVGTMRRTREKSISDESEGENGTRAGHDELGEDKNIPEQDRNIDGKMVSEPNNVRFNSKVEEMTL